MIVSLARQTHATSVVELLTHHAPLLNKSLSPLFSDLFLTNISMHLLFQNIKRIVKILKAGKIDKNDPFSNN